jgi:hypothetical protein
MAMSITVYSTEARRQFFKLLKLAAPGEEVTIVNKDTGDRFILLLFEKPVPEKDVEQILAEMAEVGLDSSKLKM